MTNNMQLKGRVALITGGAGGLGRSTVEAFEIAGAEVCRQNPDDPASPLEWFDVTQPDEVEVAVKALIDSYGKIDILANLVGTWSYQPPVHETPDEVLDRLMNINFRSVFVMCRAVIPNMIESGWGRVINIGAQSALQNSAGNGAYGASKAAVVALTDAIAEEVKEHNITANVIIPSTIDTETNRKSMPNADFSKWVAPRSIAETMVVLCTDAAGNLNGTRIPF